MSYFYHATKTGTAIIVDSWGHGRGPRADWASAPCIIVAHDNDGHSDAIRYTGKAIDAARAMAVFYLRSDGRCVVVFHGKSMTAEPTPADFWVEDWTGERKPNLAAYPNIIAF